MATKKHILSPILASILAISCMTNAFAAENINNANDVGETPVALTATAATFSVTVPTSIPVTIDTNAEVNCPDNLKIINDSAAPVEVKSIEIQEAAWHLADFNNGDRSLLAKEKVGSNQLGFAFTPDSGSQYSTHTNGTQSLSIDSTEWIVDANGSIDFVVAGIATAVKEDVSTPVNAINVVFTVGWSTGNPGGSSDNPEDFTKQEYLTFRSPSSFTLSTDSKAWNGTLEYSTDKTTWSEWNGTDVLSAQSSGGDYMLYMRGTGNSHITTYNEETGDTTGIWVLRNSDDSLISCTGNIETLLDYTEVTQNQHPTMDPYCFAGLFAGNTSLSTAPDLLSPTLSELCYAYMFAGCTALTSAPDLLATTLSNGCYGFMFNGCTSLTTAPSLPATTLAPMCYAYMFSECSSLTTAPANLPATELAAMCYMDMFLYCSSLTTAPALPANKMEDSCYYAMFARCSSLTAAPALPATELAEKCYSNMFSGCSSLTAAPALPATTLASGCYSEMFRSCQNLKLSATQTEEYTKPYRIPESETGTDSTSALDSMFSITGGTFTGTPSINTTYYLHKDNSIVPAT